jgi:hypothetical protein
MPYKGRKRQKAIVHGGKPDRIDELASQRHDSEEDTSSSSVENHEIGDHSSTENEDEDECAASPEASEHHMLPPLFARIDDQTGLSVSFLERVATYFSLLLNATYNNSPHLNSDR